VDRVEVFKVNYEFVPDNFMETYKMDSVEKADYFDKILEEEMHRQHDGRKKHQNPGGLQNKSSQSTSHPKQKLPSCLQARNDTIAKSSYRKLPTPYINLGFPKMGTSTLHSFFECGGYKSTHFRCSMSMSCAKCTSQSVLHGFPPLKECIDERPSDVFAQLDNGTYFPQLELLDEFVEGYPEATFFLTFRDMEKWYHSISHWPPRKKGPHMDERWQKMNLTGLPAGIGNNVEEFSSWYCGHAERVRSLIDKNPLQTLVEIDIEDHMAGTRMAEMFGVEEQCWGHANVNANIHPELDGDEVGLAMKFHKEKRRDSKQAKQMKGSGLRAGVVHNATSNYSDDGDDYDNNYNEKDEQNGNDGNGLYTDQYEIENERSVWTFRNRSCFIAQKSNITKSQYGQLSTPFINLGMPKMGSSSLHKFFRCGKVQSSHYLCKGNGFDESRTCRQCIVNAIERGDPPLASCGDYDAFMQIDDGSNLPQISHLKEIHEEKPNATFVLTFRPIEDWYRSLSNWPPKKIYASMRDRMQKANIPGFPSGRGKNTDEFAEWFCGHVDNVRNFVAQNPSHTLVEVDITDPTVGDYMAEAFGIKSSCWGHANANPVLKEKLREDEQNERDDIDLVDAEKVDEGESKQMITVQNHNVEMPQSSHHKIELLNHDCFQARNDSIPISLHGKLPKPFINLGFPKMGTSSLHAFFQCGGYTSYHHRCRRVDPYYTCAKCAQESITEGLSPFAKCPDSDAYTQIDDGFSFPQLTLLDEFVEGYPNATFILTFRSMQKWYDSIRNWPPRIRGPHMDDRWREMNILDLPAGMGSNVFEFSDWFCKHVERVRNRLDQHPSHALVEINIDDPENSETISKFFDIDKNCWGHRNVNGMLHVTGSEMNNASDSVHL